MRKFVYAAILTAALAGCGSGDREKTALPGDDNEATANDNSSLTEAAPVGTGAPAAGAMTPEAGAGHSAGDSAGNGGGSSAVGSPGK